MGKLWTNLALLSYSKDIAKQMRTSDKTTILFYNSEPGEKS